VDFVICLFFQESQWVYKDPQGEVQGPFSDKQMNEWYGAGYFPADLLVKKVNYPSFTPLNMLTANGKNPFTPPPPRERTHYSKYDERDTRDREDWRKPGRAQQD